MNDADGIIKLVEYETRYLALSDFSDEDAKHIFSQFGNKVIVDWPTPKTAGRWQLTSQGWVGFVPLAEKRGISLQPKVPLKNLFQMLEYAYDLRSFKLLEGLYDCESIRDFYDRLANILSKRLLKRAREGLYKIYQEERENIGFVRGRMDMSIFAKTPVKTLIPCIYEEHAIDNTDNQIVAWTLHTILRSGICSGRSIPELRKAEAVLRNSVSLKPFWGNDCIGRNYNRLNEDYEVMHKLCRFFLENTGPTQNIGNRSMIPFLVYMPRLFELFVAQWLKQNLNARYVLKSQESLHIGEKDSMKMVMDLVLYNLDTSKPICVLDTKYKAHNTVLPDDYSKVVAYGDAIGCDETVLIYPKPLEFPFNEKPGKVRVKTVVFDIGGELEENGNKMLTQLALTIP